VSLPATVGVVGAGTMGAGIAQLAAQSGARTLVYDADPAALKRGLEAARGAIARMAEKGRLSQQEAHAAAARLERAPAFGQLAPCGLVIEAAPERLELKQRLFAELEDIVADDALLATNTSSLLVTACAATARHPERIVGMHFFNPAPVMRLVEVIAGTATSEEALARAVAAGEGLGRRVIVAQDGPGFLVNRANRPFGLEALRLVQEGVATPEQVDRIVRLGGGFRMGPFELMDLVGIDVGFEIAKSFFEQGFAEPRWRPSPLQARMAASGRHGRKTGRGWYDYSSGEHRPPDPEPPAVGGGDGLLVIAGDSLLAYELAERAAQAGWQVADPAEAEGEVPTLILDLGAVEDDPPLQGGPQAVLLQEGSLAAVDPAGTAVGFHLLAPLEGTRLVELTTGPSTPEAALATAERVFATLGLLSERVGDSPGLVLGRIVAQLVNEGSFAVMEGVGSAEDLDDGMVLGMNHPRGPLAWGDQIGLDNVLALLDALFDEQRDPRYRAAPLLRRMVLEGSVGRITGQGFHAHELDAEWLDDGHAHHHEH
jgi:3-hydroxybutyryl-CoA dehydrogenase